MTMHSQALAAKPRGVLLQLFPIVLAVFTSFLAIGMALPVLPLHLQSSLSLGPTAIGLVIGCQFGAALLSRAWAGATVDLRGARRAALLGLALAAASGVVYWLSSQLVSTAAALALLVASRLLLGCGESLIVTGALGWGVALAGAAQAGRVMAWVGIAMYGAYAAGAPLGIVLYTRYGFAGAAAAAALLPLLAMFLCAPLAGPPPAATRRIPFYKVVGAVWLPGLGLALASIGFGAITAFAALLFAARGWGSASLVFSAFGIAFIGARILFGHLPDRYGARLALACVLIEAVGLLIVWQAASPAMACLGAAVTGFGYSLAFPGFGVEAVRRAPPQNRGAAMGAYVAFLDIALALCAPLAGLVAARWNVGAVYLAGAATVAAAGAVAVALLNSARS